MKKNNLRFYTLTLVVLMVFLIGISAHGQTTGSATMSLPEFIREMGLPKDKLEKTLKLTRDFLTQLQAANLEVTKLMTPPNSGSKPDPKAKEKFASLKQRFGTQMKKYHLDLEGTTGQTKALRIAEKIHKIIPLVLIEGLKMPGMNQIEKITKETSTSDTTKENTTITGTNRLGANSTSSTNPITALDKIDKSGATLTGPLGNGPQEVPLGSPVTDSNSSSSGLDLQIVGNSSSSSSGHDHGNGNGMNGMDGMMSMMSGMMGNMGNMSGTNNNQAMNGMDMVNRQLVLQLLSNNAAIVQMLATLSYQESSENFPILLQPIYQLLANQSSLIQMLYSNFNTALTSGQSGG